jgi:hypothetical protein
MSGFSQEFETRFLDKMEDIDAALCMAINDLKMRSEVVETKTRHLRESAPLLIALGYPQLTESSFTGFDFDRDKRREIYPFWIVTGVPSKRGRPLADKWMKDRGLQWSGDARSLRQEVENALIRGEQVPRFGFRIELTTLRKSYYVYQSSSDRLTPDQVGPSLPASGENLV